MNTQCSPLISTYHIFNRYGKQTCSVIDLLLTHLLTVAGVFWVQHPIIDQVITGISIYFWIDTYEQYPVWKIFEEWRSSTLFNTLRTIQWVMHLWKRFCTRSQKSVTLRAPVVVQRSQLFYNGTFWVRKDERSCH